MYFIYAILIRYIITSIRKVMALALLAGLSVAVAIRLFVCLIT